MNIPQRKAVSPIIATLLLIAIAVAAGIIVYVFVGGLSGNLTKSGGNQVTEQLSMVAYRSSAPNSTTYAFVLNVRNTGTSSVTLSSIYYDGNVMKEYSLNGTNDYGTTAISIPANPAWKFASVQLASTISFGSGTFSMTVPTLEYLTIPVGGTAQLVVTIHGSANVPSSGTSQSVKVVTQAGSPFTFNIIAGSSG